MKHSLYRGADLTLQWWFDPVELSRYCLYEYNKPLNTSNPAWIINGYINLIDSMCSSVTELFTPECNLSIRYKEFTLDVKISRDLTNSEINNKYDKIRCEYNEFGGYKAFLSELVRFSKAAFSVFKNINAIRRVFGEFKNLNCENISDCFEICRIIEDNFIFYTREECLYYSCLVSAIIRNEERRIDALLADCHVGSSNDLEYQVGMFLRNKGFPANYHQDQNCFGLNFVSITESEAVVIQCENKDYETGVDAIMKAYAACKYYNYSRAVVYSTSKFTDDAIVMAKGLEVETISVPPCR